MKTYRGVLSHLLQEQALHAVHSILMLVEKDTGRPEKQPGLQVRPNACRCHLVLSQQRKVLIYLPA